MSNAAMAAAKPELNVATTGVPVAGSTWDKVLKLIKVKF